MERPDVEALSKLAADGDLPVADLWWRIPEICRYVLELEARLGINQPRVCPPYVDGDPF